ncbi:MAG: hypothetical protein AAB790_02950, partial [Patescibacteria group bacterium]
VYNNPMQSSPLSSFTRFLFGFTLLISISFGVTFAVQKYATGQDAAKQQAAAAAAMLEYKK